MDYKGLQILGLALSLVVGALGCAKLDVNATVEGQVGVVHSVDTDTIYAFFLDLCDGDEACAQQETFRFLDWLYSTGDTQ